MSKISALSEKIKVLYFWCYLMNVGHVCGPAFGLFVSLISQCEFICSLVLRVRPLFDHVGDCLHLRERSSCQTCFVSVACSGLISDRCTLTHSAAITHSFTINGLGKFLWSSRLISDYPFCFFTSSLFFFQVFFVFVLHRLGQCRWSSLFLNPSLSLFSYICIFCPAPLCYSTTFPLTFLLCHCLPVLYVPFIVSALMSIPARSQSLSTWFSS